MEVPHSNYISKNIGILATFCVIFFMWGLLTNLNFVLINHLTTIFNVNYSISSLIGIVFFSAYLVVSLPAGRYINKIGYKKAIFYGWVSATLGCFIFFAAVYSRYYIIFLIALFVLAGGITMLQVGANLYVVLLGERKTAASRLNLVQAFNSLGTLIAPLLATRFLLFMVDLPADYKASLSKADLFPMEFPYVHFPYLFLGVLMAIFAVYLWFAFIPQIETKHIEPVNEITSLRRRHVMHFSQLRLGAFAIFAYVGAEVALGRYLGRVAEDSAEYYWGLAMVGRFIGAILLLKITPRTIIAVCAGTAALLVITSILTTGEVSAWAIVSIGLFNSILFPSIFTLGVNGLGKFSVEGSAVLIMFIVGGAIIPFQVVNFAYVSNQLAFIIVLICYFYIILYGLKLSRFEKNRLRKEGLE
jgi:FHS family L-fucose permease-like MFS transporter